MAEGLHPRTHTIVMAPDLYSAMLKAAGPAKPAGEVLGFEFAGIRLREDKYLKSRHGVMLDRAGNMLGFISPKDEATEAR